LNIYISLLEKRGTLSKQQAKLAYRQLIETVIHNVAIDKEPKNIADDVKSAITTSASEKGEGNA